MIECDWVGEPGCWKCPRCGGLSRRAEPPKAECLLADPEALPYEDPPEKYPACRHRVDTGTTVPCRTCGHRENATEVYRCESPLVVPEFATFVRVRSGNQYACCAWCKYAEP